MTEVTTIKVRQLLDSPMKWTKHYRARDVDGKEVTPRSEEAVKWCLLGAVNACYYFEDVSEVNQKIRERLGLDINQSIASWNDSYTRLFSEVKNLVNELDI